MRLFLTALLLKEFAGWDITVSVLVMGTATILYTYLGGMEAVIWTDLIQFAVYILGAVVAAGFILGQVNGGWSGFVATGEAAGKFALFDFSLDATKPFNFWAGLVGGAFFTMASHGADQLMVQRFLCARSLRAARAALVGSGFVVLAQFLLFLLIGIGLYVVYRQGTVPLPPEVAARTDAVFGYYIVHYLPAGVIGLLIAAVLSAAMSTLSSSLNSSAGAVVNDFYRPFRPGRCEEHYLRVARGMTTVWGFAQMGVALVAAAALEHSVIEMVLSIAGFTTGMVLGLFLLGRMSRPVGSAAALIGLVVGFLAVLAVRVGTPVAWPWYAPIGTLTTVAVALAFDRAILSHGSPPNRSPEPGLDRPG
jgi:SSS family transporter